MGREPGIFYKIFLKLKFPQDTTVERLCLAVLNALPSKADLIAAAVDFYPS